MITIQDCKRCWIGWRLTPRSERRHMLDYLECGLPAWIERTLHGRATSVIGPPDEGTRDG